MAKAEQQKQSVLDKINSFKAYLDKIAKHVKDGTLSDANYTPMHSSASLLDTEIWDYLKSKSRK